MRLFRTVMCLSLLFFIPNLFALEQDQSCGSLKPKPAKDFRPFNFMDDTGKAIDPNQVVSLSTPAGIVVKKTIGELEAELNALEHQANAIGYSFHEDEISPADIVQCLGAEPDVSEFLADDFSFGMDSDNAFMAGGGLPGGGGGGLPGGGGSPGPVLPKLPDLSQSNVIWTPASLKAVLDKSWGFDIGSKEKFYTGLFPYLLLKASPLEVRGAAGVRWRAAVMGKWDGELAHVYAQGASPGTSSAFAEIAVEVIDGKRVWAKPLVQTEPFTLSDRYQTALNKSIDFRFVVGPVPMKARIGVQGEVGLKYSVKVYPLQVGASTIPWIGAEAFAQLGGDIGGMGGGLGGTVILIKDSLVVQGNSMFAYESGEPVIKLKGDVTNKAEALSGELYAFAYAYLPIPKPPFLKKWEMRFPLFYHTGYAFEQNLFNFNQEFHPKIGKKS